MLSKLQRLHGWMAAHLGLTLASLALVLAALGLVASRTQVDQDVAALLPGGPGSPQEAARLLSEFGALDTLVLDLSVPGASPDALVAAGSGLAERLRASGRFAQVYTGPSGADLIKLGQALVPRRLYLLEDPKAELERRLRPEALAASLQGLKEQLTSPQAMGMKQQLLADPLGLNGELLSGMSRSAGALEYHAGHLLSKDKQHLLVVATPRSSALAVDSSQAILDLLAAEARSLPAGPSGPAVLAAVGGPRFAAESAALVRRDVVMNFVTSALALVAIFLLRFRSLRLLLLGSLPLGFGVVAGLAVVVLVEGRIHGLSLGFGAALIGIAIDYPLHLLNRASNGEGAPLSRVGAAFADVWSSLWLGWATTVAAFSALFLSRFPGLRELGLFAGAGVTAAFLCTLVWLPPIVARLGPAKGRPFGFTPRLLSAGIGRWPALAITLALAVGGGALAFRVGFDGELRNLDAQKPETLRQYDEVMGRFGQGGGGSLAVVKASDAEGALQQNDQVAKVLRGQLEQGRLKSLNALDQLLPSQRTQLQRGERLRELDLAAAKAQLSAAAEGQGFNPQAFDAFWAEVDAAAQGRLPPLRPEDLASTSLGPIVERALRCNAQGCRAVTAFDRPATTEISGLKALLPQDVTLLDGGALAADTVAQIPRQLLLLCGLGLLVNLLMLAIAYRSLWAALVACLPCVLAMVVTVGLLSAFDVPLNLVSASALVMVLGCGVDYGIFVFHGLKAEQAPSGVEAVGVLLASATTLAGFGTLAMANHKALQSLGVAVGLGILGSAFAALLLMPGLHAVFRREAKG